MTWREKLAPVIRGVIAAHDDGFGYDIRTALRTVWVKLGLRRSHYAYGVWCDECNRQLGVPRPKRKIRSSKAVPISPLQPGLF